MIYLINGLPSEGYQLLECFEFQSSQLNILIILA